MAKTSGGKKIVHVKAHVKNGVKVSTHKRSTPNK